MGLGLAKAVGFRRKPVQWAPLAGSVIDLDFTRGASFGATLNDLSNANASGGNVEDSGGNWSWCPANTVRRSDRGLLIEETRTNSVLNNTLQGAVAGSPGTLPTGHSLSTPAGLTRTLSIETINGVPCLRIRLQGVTTSAAGIQYNIGGGADIAAADTQAWAASAFVQSIRSTGLDQAAFWLMELWNYAAGSAFLNTGSASIPRGRITVVPGALTRLVTLRTLADATTASVRPCIRFGGNSVAAGIELDVEFVIGWPQAELCGATGIFATSPFPTTGTAATRNADTITSAWLAAYADTNKSTYSTLYDVVISSGPTSTLVPGGFCNAAVGFNSASYVSITASTGRSAMTMQNGGVGQLAGLSPNVFMVAGTPFKMMVAVSPTSSNMATAGVLGTEDTASTAITEVADRFTLGISPWGAGGNHINGYLRRYTLWASRLPDVTLQSLTV